jgi:DNA-binding transcriptional MerR regulator
MTREEKTVQPEFRFRPPDRGKMWGQLALTIRQAAELTGVSERQIQYWLNQGYLPTSVYDNRRISGDALELIDVIKQARSVGIPLRRAVTMAKEFLARQHAGPLAGDHIVPETLVDLEEKLIAARNAIEMVRMVLTKLREAQAAKE